ncbi:pH signal transduction protein PalH [Aspergillus heteromorphus CBS 117.55]|uniref:pH signal transduction protein PalH n=1 Tax=Aspergillus heteromorphus CBS 117.55 TaxID=1448321 RepID=A0A317V6N8_9EURO|nr:pH signal transduction protein PalH [Aspergillus heteromorphus CBS 117.55]PWY69705.1 pH signal transduction protein PalH [Aspergillus heteromorphus CBS 117.55]
MGDPAHLAPRQIWAQPTTSTVRTYEAGCTPFLLPSNGYVYLNRSYSISLTANAIYDPICTSTASATAHAVAALDLTDPFYSSVTPELYAMGCTTVVSYLLVIILLITPRTFYVGGPGGGANFLGRHGMISGSYSGNSSVVGVGGRPWLQKVAALLVAVSLTIATVDSFRVAEKQYYYGYSDAEALADAVIDGLEIRVVRVISTTFLWLAQVQTLIRLFPRHKEKIMIKWAGFALIVFDTTFSVLDKFLVKTDTVHPRLYEDAIPALSYLFELALNLLYAAWVIFYSLSKHRFAFFHPKMRNICLVALLSLCAVLIPVVFFVLDIAKPKIAGWGTYVRWVGSAAASVVVWEWVERIEALERDERKDGILGREIFDGDEMLEVTPSEEVDWPRYNPDGNDRGGGAATSSGWGGMMGLAHRPLRTRVGRNWQSNLESQQQTVPIDPRRRRATARPTPPPAVVTPVSRADTTSAASTVYNVHYHPVSSPTPPVAMPHMEEEDEDTDDAVVAKEMSTVMDNQPPVLAHDPLSAQQTREQSPQIVHMDKRWRALLNPFKRRRASLPREVASAQAEEEAPAAAEVEQQHLPADESDDEHSLHHRSESLFTLHRRLRPGSGRQGSNHPLPVTVIPARRRGQQTWSPQRFHESSLLESVAPSQRAPSDHDDLPVRVIQPQTRTAAPWSTTDGEGFGNANYELRYDPEAAALVEPGDRGSYHLPVPETEGSAGDPSWRGQDAVLSHPAQEAGAADGPTLPRDTLARNSDPHNSEDSRTPQ